MMFSSYLMKMRAMKALRGNWQTALLVTFFSGILVTAYSLIQVNIEIDPNTMDSQAMVQAMTRAVAAIPAWTWWLMIGLRVLSALVTPVLELGSNHYFVARLGGEELGFKGLFSRKELFWRAFLLQLYMGLKIFLWSLLFVVPGIMASLRYSMAPYYLAEDPSLSVRQAVEKSKEAMINRKGNLFWLELSFLGWFMATIAVQLLLAGMSPVAALVAYQFTALFVQTYRNGAVGAFYLTVSGTDPQAAQMAEAAVNIGNEWYGEADLDDGQSSESDAQEEPETSPDD